MEAAERLGVALRRWEGWEPTTFYTYDENGRLVSSTPEPEWDEQERAWMLALEAYRRGRCTRCGGNLAETTDVRNDDAYHVLAPIQCHRCAAFARADDQYREHQHPLSLMHRIELRRR